MPLFLVLERLRTLNENALTSIWTNVVKCNWYAIKINHLKFFDKFMDKFYLFDKFNLKDFCMVKIFVK